jgi:hypothetical protein
MITISEFMCLNFFFIFLLAILSCFIGLWLVDFLFVLGLEEGSESEGGSWPG